MLSEIIIAPCQSCGERTWIRLRPERAVCLSCGAAECRCCHPPVQLPPAGATPCPPPLRLIYGASARITETPDYILIA